MTKGKYGGFITIHQADNIAERAERGGKYYLFTQGLYRGKMVPVLKIYKDSGLTKLERYYYIKKTNR